MKKQILIVAAQSILCSTVFGERSNVGLSTEELEVTQFYTSMKTL